MTPDTDNVLRIDPTEPGADIKMMKTPDLWPTYPVLCLMHPERKEGVMLAGPGFSRTTVWKVNVFDARLRPLVQGDPNHGLESEEYSDIEAIYDAGWRVD